jgi:hypothetical protein
MSRFIKNGPDKEMKNAREVRETILTLHEDELDNALWINDLHIVPMTREAEPEIPHEVGAGQLEMFLDLVCSLSTTSAAFFLDITYRNSARTKRHCEALTELVGTTKGAKWGTVAYIVRQFLRDELGADIPTKNTTRRRPAKVTAHRSSGPSRWPISACLIAARILRRSGHGWRGVDRPSPHPSRTSRQGLMAWELAGMAIVRRIASLITCGACWGSMCPA